MCGVGEIIVFHLFVFGVDGVGGVKKIVCHFRAEKYSGPVFVVQNLTP